MAKKIRLNVDDLAVQSYATGEQPRPRGTVHGHAYWSDPRVCPHTEDWHCTVNEIYCTHPDACRWSYANHTCVGEDCLA